MIPRFHPDFGLLEFITLFKRNKNAVKQFEKRFAKKFQSNKAIAFPYGRSALWCFLKSLDIHDSEIILPSYTCSVVAHAIKLSGNIPVFVDIIVFHEIKNQFPSGLTHSSSTSTLFSWFPF